jgi:hypothetical protein
MRRTSQLSPGQLAALTGLGGLLAASSFFALYDPLAPPHHHPSHFLARLLLFISFLVLGGTVAYRSATTLELGIVSQRWPEPQIDSLRTLLQSRNVFALTILLLIGFIAVVVLSTRFNSVAWTFNALLLTLNFLRSHVPSKPRPIQESLWSNLAPINSDHWGHPSN